MRPGLFPILDSYLMKFYRATAREAANEVRRQRPSMGRLTTLYWEATRQDILRSEAALQELREVLTASEAPMAQTAARRLSDLRLLDMLAWAASS